MSDEDKEQWAIQSRKNWDNKTEAEKAAFIKAGQDAVRQAAKHGSKLEKFLNIELIKNGYITQFHRTHLIMNTNLEIDIFLPEIGVAVEIDGVSHIKDVWGKKAFIRNRRSDLTKSGLLLKQGYCILRVLQTRPISQKYQREMLNKLLSALEKVQEKFPPLIHRNITIEL